MKVCLFSHYSNYNYIPNYVLYYLEKLTEISDEVILLTNERTISNLDLLEKLNIKYHLYENKGYDFGMYYRYLTENHPKCDKLILANDSMIVFDSLKGIGNWIDNTNGDLMSITSSIENSHHLQSYFWVLNKEVQVEFIAYLLRNGIIEDFDKVVNIYEIGFSQHLLKNGYNLLSKYRYISKDSSKYNTTIHNPKSIIEEGNPIIKKKVVMNSFRPEEKNFLRSVGYNFSIDYWGYILEKKEETLNIDYLKKL